MTPGDYCCDKKTGTMMTYERKKKRMATMGHFMRRLRGALSLHLTWAGINCSQFAAIDDQIYCPRVFALAEGRLWLWSIDAVTRQELLASTEMEWKADWVGFEFDMGKCAR
jgi:predicted nucleic acid-binding Zn ribbon protein